MNPLKGGPPQGGWRRTVLRAPIPLYRWGLGALLGRRLVLLTHIGRKSGQPRQVCLEVVGRGEEPGSFVIASGYGERSQWFRNILAHPGVRYQVGGRTYEGTAVPYAPEESGRRLAAYAERHPRTAATLMDALGHAPQSAEEYVAIGADRTGGVPLVALRPSTGNRQAGAGFGGPL
ncbi:nitroreductase family deazaflavin-dependent oxidoreductase [Streptomyces sp. DSM 42041]|uniref:Nitroreductase family deazaflavin-dependent oxidoreductase n=1 Tax=Streptomyces hazeniae TaxID=3075538 RepID=A0ABU2NNE0_9ACTN|nr:nitroreductase family deazaflavin-dependent oxidoreductase [Streptomyces sp. DSM 42041]MDT0378478.1 nitroreductase family deazaflavin-dependent oxidoreductase [Streptomyces sp. DSM 42041]